MRQSAQSDKPQWRMARAPMGTTLAALLASCGFYRDWRDENNGVQTDSLNAPPGHRLTLFALGMPKARHKVMVTGGTLSAGSTAESDQMEPSLTGFLQGRRYWGWPVDVLMMRNGSVRVSDDLNGPIYRVARER